MGLLYSVEYVKIANKKKKGWGKKQQNLWDLSQPFKYQKSAKQVRKFYPLFQRWW